MIEVPEFWQAQKAIITEKDKQPYEISLFMECLLASKTESDNMTFENTLAIAKITDECRKQIIPF